ncbi:hypothetical protein HDU97_003488 [Phlyctochytrium planicorne]|nr:hypothetical protein HDU97_003488 [Phlyctochytrium planicorne]
MSSPARLQLLQQVKASVLSSVIPKGASPLESRFQPVAQKMKDYYFPDIDVAKLSEQDSSLSSLGLKDQWVLSRLSREEEWTKRGKIVRVGVLTGRRKKVEGEGKQKKRK